MSKDKSVSVHALESAGTQKPNISVRKIGIVTRDYTKEFPNKRRDFSYSFSDILRQLDDAGCDAVLFSLFSIIPRSEIDYSDVLNGLKNIKSIFIEEFEDGETRKAGRYVVLHRTLSGWKDYDFSQVFGTATDMPRQELDDFVRAEVPKRIMGECCVLLCGETNGVKYSKLDKKVHDTFGLRAAIPSDVRVLLNPIHDRMTRFEMKLKRKFLSEGGDGRWVISVWNKGKRDSAGKTKDGNGPAWTVYHNGHEQSVEVISNNHHVDIGILDIRAL